VKRFQCDGVRDGWQIVSREVKAKDHKSAKVKFRKMIPGRVSITSVFVLA